MVISLSSRFAVAAFFVLALSFNAVRAQENPAETAAEPSKTSKTVSSPVAELMKRYPAGTINSDETAGNALDDVKKVRSEVDAKLQKAQRECTKKFLVTKCRDEAKAQRRLDRQQLKLIENEAARFQRQQKVIERDQALTDKREKEEANAEKRAEKQEKYEEKQAEREARQQEAASRSRSASSSGTGAVSPVGKKKGLTSEERAENIRLYEKKLSEVEKNQKKVAARKSENEKKRAMKKAKAAKEKERAAADAAKMNQVPISESSSR